MCITMIPVFVMNAQEKEAYAWTCNAVLAKKPGLTGKVLKKADTPTWLEPCQPLYQFHRSLQDELHHQGMLTARKQFLINI